MGLNMFHVIIIRYLYSFVVVVIFVAGKRHKNTRDVRLIIIINVNVFAYKFLIIMCASHEN